MLLMLSMVAGLSLMSLSRARTRPDGAETSSTLRDAVVGTLWVLASFVGIVVGLAACSLAVAWLIELP
jgi:hypothetical protein